MAYVVERKSLSLSERMYIPQILAGMKVTLKHLFAPNVTLEYPEQRPPIPPGYRGVPTLVKDPNGREKCVSCQLCEFVCPPKAIRITPGEIPTEGMSKRLNPGEQPGARSIARNPMGRPGRMEELQNLAAFLMAPGQCDWLTGQSIMMDGGNSLATGGNFYELRQWSDADWQVARQRIEAQNAKDKQQR